MPRRKGILGLFAGRSEINRRNRRGLRSRRVARARFSGYILLETVVATGILIVGLAVIGAQIQGAVTSVRQMERRMRAVALADVQLAEMSLGLIEFDSMDDTQEEDFGPRYPDFGWRLTVDDTAVDDLFQLVLQVLYYPRSDYGDDFNFDEADVVHTVYTFRVAPRELDLGEAFGIPEDQFEELSTKLLETGIQGLDPAAFDPTIFGKLDFEELIEVMPLLLDAFGIPLDEFTNQLTPDLKELLESSGVLEGLGGDDATGTNLIGGQDDQQGGGQSGGGRSGGGR